jgi:hypothetical protein
LSINQEYVHHDNYDLDAFLQFSLIWSAFGMDEVEYLFDINLGLFYTQNTNDEGP